MSKQVLLVRPEGRNESLAARLLAHHIEPVIIPVMTIEPRPLSQQAKECVMNLDRYDHIVFVSRSAVQYGLPHIDRYWPQMPHRLAWYAVGPATADELSKFDFDPYVPSKATSEGLLALDVLADLEDHQVMIVRGVGGRELIAAEISARGAQVDEIEVYERLPARISADERTRIDALKGAVAAIYSGETLELFIANATDPWSRFRLVVPSARIAGLARDHGFNDVIDAGGADDEAMCTVIVDAFAGT